MSKDKEYVAMINTHAWRKLRLRKLSLQPLCERCNSIGLVTSATEVHHIIPVESVSNMQDKRRMMFSISNLMSVCHPCHKELHRELCSGGREERERRRKEQREDFQRLFFGE